MTIDDWWWWQIDGRMTVIDGKNYKIVFMQLFWYDDMFKLEEEKCWYWLRDDDGRPTNRDEVETGDSEHSVVVLTIDHCCS